MTSTSNKNTAPLWTLTLADASARIANQSLSPRDLLEAYLERIATVDDRIHSYIHVAATQAREAAIQAGKEIAAGHWKGPLHGLPFAVKDNYDVAGMPATAGSRLRLKHIPMQDAALVQRLKAAGAVLIGKLSTSTCLFRPRAIPGIRRASQAVLPQVRVRALPQAPHYLR